MTCLTPLYAIVNEALDLNKARTGPGSSARFVVYLMTPIIRLAEAIKGCLRLSKLISRSTRLIFEEKVSKGKQSPLKAA